MTIESATYISSLNASNPAASDPKSEGDDHIRLLKSTVKATFPNVAGAVTPTHTELNFVDGVTSAIQTQLDAKASLTGTETLTNKTVNLTSNTLTGTTAQFNTALSDGDFATLAGTETLTNKTLTAPVLTNPTVTASSGTAMKVTNTGTGDSFVVEDSASTDATPFVIDASGKVGVGIVTGTFGATVSASDTGLSSGISGLNYAADTNGFGFRAYKTRNASPYSQTIVANADLLGYFAAYGSDGSSYIQAAIVKAEVDGTPGLNDMPGRLVFSTTADGASSPTERMRIDSASVTTLYGPNDGPIPTLKFSWLETIIPASDTQIAGIEFDSRDSSNPGTSSFIKAYADAVNQGYLTFGTGVGGSATERMRIDSAGNVLVGTTATANFAAGTASNSAALGIGAAMVSRGSTAIRAHYELYNPNGRIGAIGAEGTSLVVVTGATDIERLRIDSSGNLLITSSGGLGYGTGSGGTVTQATSRTTGVTLNKTNGAITLFTAAGSATATTFTVTNSTVAATDVVHVSVKSGTNVYLAFVTATAAGSFNITFYTTGGTSSDAPVFNFAVIKAVTA